MRDRDRCRRVVIVGVLLAVVAPAVLDRDSFPLSTYPVYASARPATARFVTAVGLRSDGSERRLPMSAIAATDDPLIAASHVSDAVTGGRAVDLCRQIAGRVSADVAVVVIVTDSHDLVRAARGDPSLLSRTEHARCEVSA